MKHLLVLSAAALALTLSPLDSEAVLVANLSGAYDGATHGTYEQYVSTTPFYLSNANVLSDITVSGTVDVSGLSGGGSVLFVGLHQPGGATVILNSRLQAGFFGDVEGGMGQGLAGNTGENVQINNIPLASPLTNVNLTFDAVSVGTPIDFSSTFTTPGGPVTRTINYNDGTFTGDLDLTSPVYPFVMAFASDITQSASFNVTFTQAAVPEPTAALFGTLLAGGLGLTVGRRRNKD